MKSNHDNHEAADSFTNFVREAVNHEALPSADPALREALLKRLDQPLVEPALSVAAASRRRTFFQRAGIALVSTAALGVAALIWQRPIESVIGRNDSHMHREKYGDSVTDPMRTAPATDGRATDALGLEVSLKNDPQNALPIVDAFQGRREGNPTQDYRSTVWPRVKERYGEGQPQMTNGPFGSGGGAAQSNGQGRPNEPIDAITATGTTPGKAAGEPAANSGYANSPAPRGGRVNDSRPAGDAYRLPTSDDELQALPPAPQPAATAKVERWKHIAPAEKAPAPDPARPDFWEGSEGQSESLVKEIQVREEISVGKRLAKPNEKAIEEPSIGLALNGRARADVRTKDSGKPGDGEPLNQLAGVTDQKSIRELQEVEKGRESSFRYYAAPQGGEQYAKIIENQFLNPNIDQYALSTFSIDVDTASYANVRRFLNNGQLPPPDAVRLEEMVNYFKYKYPQPKGDEPFSVNTEMADCPWQPGHKLLRVGLQGKEIHRAERPASNIVFLIDTSGSMTDQNKLPLLKQAFTMLVGELNENDKVTMVTYAGNAGLRLPPTRGHEKETIIAAIDGLQSGGSTHGSAGISLAYEIAAAQFIKGGTNKVILATDGDLNVGITDDAALVELITKKAETGVFLTVLGVGTGNLKDAKMERLADNGNGVYAYLDSVREARKVLVEEMSGSLVTIAQDVKIQLEFNPAQVASYRLLGYENRVMANQDFRNDAKDAGEIGAGHSVTAMYEVVMVGAPEAKAADAKTPETETLRYQRVAPPAEPKKELTEAGKSGELLMVRLRYKKPEAKKEDAAKELAYPLTDKGGSFNSASKEFQFASAVVAFGLSLRNSEFRGSTNLSAVAEMAQPALGEDNGGHRAEFLDLVRRAKSLRGE